MTRAEVHALVAILHRKLPGLAPQGLAEPVATAEAVDVLMALLALLPLALRTSIEREAELDPGVLMERLASETRLGSKTAPRLLLGLFTEKEGTRH
jgi:hypothetical protein